MKTELSHRDSGCSEQPSAAVISAGLISAGAGGKTTVRIPQLLSAAAERTLTGEHVFVRCRVLIVCLEDDMTELRRRVWAAMLHHHVEPADVKDFLLLTTPRKLKIAEIKDKAGHSRRRRPLSRPKHGDRRPETRHHLHRPSHQGAFPE